MGYNGIMIDLMKLGKTQRDLLEELKKRGYPRLYQQQLSAYIRGTVCGPQSEAVIKIVHEIIDNWRNEKRAAI